MLLALLLQTTSVKTSDLNAVYIALGGTLVASLIAAVASFVASSRAAKTAEKVVALSTQTTHDVAALSAQVSRESATLAARTAQELKDKDYKNDFYKRIIEKRLKAWQDAEVLLEIIAPALKDYNAPGGYFAYFSDKEKFDIVFKQVRNSMTTQALWMGKEYTQHLKSLHNMLVEVEIQYKKEYRDFDGEEFPADSVIKHLGKTHFVECKKYFKLLLSTLGTQVRTLYDVETFFDQLSNLALYEYQSEETQSSETIA